MREGVNMAYVQGWVLGPKGFIEGYLEFDGGSIKRISEGPPPSEPEARGIIIPPIPNGHTHLADTGLRGKLPHGLSVSELVGPPDGFKHKELRDRRVVVSGLETGMKEIARLGTRDFSEFREGGMDGVNIFREVQTREGKALKPRVMGRTSGPKYDEKEVDSILAVADGMGISSAADWPWPEIKALADHVRAKGRPLAIHVSEGEREDIGRILELRPTYIIHMVRATLEDMEAVAKAKVPVVVCPKANLYFKRLPSINLMLRCGVDVCVGTDNGMFGELSVLDELSIMCKSAGVRPSHAWDILTRTWGLFNPGTGMNLEAGAPADFVVINVPSQGVGASPVRDPIEYVTRRAMGEDVYMVSLGERTIKAGHGA